MKKTKIIYWSITVLTLIGFLISAVTEIIHAPKTFTDTTELLGYPPYFLRLLGTAKLIGIVVLLFPGYNRLKEWAYAGFTIDCIAALWSQVAVGNVMGTIQPVVVLSFVLLSYYFLRKLQNDMDSAPSMKSSLVLDRG